MGVLMGCRCPSQKCALSHYPPSWDQEGNAVVLICKSHWDEGSKLPSFAPLAYDVKIGQFMPTPFTGEAVAPLAV